MSLLPKEKWAKILVISAFAILIGAAIYLFFGKLLSILLPFVLAFGIGRTLQSPIRKLRQRIKLPKAILGFLLVSIVIFFIGFVCFLFANQLVAEFQRLFEKLSRNSEGILSSVTSLLDETERKFPFIYEYLDRDVIKGSVTEVIKNSLTTLTSRLADALTAFVRGLPDIGLFFVVFVIASYYFTMDNDRISDNLSGLLPKKLKNKLSSTLKELRCACAGYIKAYAIILLITFSQLFVGFLILKINYATTLAIIIAILDMLPVIGTGTILVPWGIISLIMGDYRIGTGILVLFGIISVVREVIEPKIIGSSIGMHPLLTLVAMYVGYKLFGLWGLIILPPAVIPLRSFIIALQKRKTQP